ncbi:MAG: glutamate 5-kinase [Eubacteriales bacterium]|nr:glutamate 5-kinase [Eubacteriales bacterium]
MEKSMQEKQDERAQEKEARERLSGKKRIIIKIGSSSVTHPETGDVNLHMMEKLVRLICDLQGSGKDVMLVSSGAIAAGRKAMNFSQKPQETAVKQALAAIGQAKLMMVYQKLFSEYNHTASQILLTKFTLLNEEALGNARNTFEELFKLKSVPIINENDTVSTNEISFGDNDRLASLCASITDADLVILLSDIEGLYTDDPNRNPDAQLISFVPYIDETLWNMAKSSSKTSFGTGGMRSKIEAARIATDAGADMLIMSGQEIDSIWDALSGMPVGTLFAAHKTSFDLLDYVRNDY